MLVLMFPPSLGHVVATARADLLTRWFQRNVGLEVRIELASSYQQLREAITHGRVDLAWAPPIVCAQVYRSCLGVLKAVRGGRSKFRSALVVREGAVRRIQDLRGGRAAWIDPLSTAGYLLPVAYLRERGLPPEQLLSRQEFLGSYRKALRAVIEGQADLTAIYARQATPEAFEASVTELINDASRLSLVAFTHEAPSDGLVIVDRPGLAPVYEQLLALGQGSKATMLLTIFDADALEPAVAEDYDALRLALP